MKNDDEPEQFLHLKKKGRTVPFVHSAAKVCITLKTLTLRFSLHKHLAIS